MCRIIQIIWSVLFTKQAWFGRVEFSIVPTFSVPYFDHWHQSFGENGKARCRWYDLKWTGARSRPLRAAARSERCDYCPDQAGTHQCPCEYYFPGYSLAVNGEEPYPFTPLCRPSGHFPCYTIPTSWAELPTQLPRTPSLCGFRWPITRSSIRSAEPSAFHPSGIDAADFSQVHATATGSIRCTPRARRRTGPPPSTGFCRPRLRPRDRTRGHVTLVTSQ